MGLYLETVMGARPAQTLMPWATSELVTTPPELAGGEPSGWLQDVLRRPWIALRWKGDASGLADKSISSVGFVLALDLRLLGLSRACIVKALGEWPLRPRAMGWVKQTVDRVDRYIGCETNEKSGDPPTLFNLDSAKSMLLLGSGPGGLSERVNRDADH